jgi:DNA polymerase III alpha subunit
MDVAPLFKSHYSIGRSILTLESQSSANGGCDSIIDICEKSGLKSFFLIDDSMSGFLQAYINANDAGVKMIFGLRLSVCPDMDQKEAESADKTCKYIIVCKNTAGYKRLIKIYSEAATRGSFYNSRLRSYIPRADFKLISSLWDDDDLQLAVPFYDSFLHENYLQDKWCPEPPSDFKLDFFIEDNDLPFEYLILNRINKYVLNNKNCNLVNAQSIYYKDKKDFKAYLTFRAINQRTTLGKPNFEHMGSDKFSFESWKEKTNEKTS